jgi:hypothetical protein
LNNERRSMEGEAEKAAPDNSKRRTPVIEIKGK